MLKIIVNPVAGRGAAARAMPEIECRLIDYGVEYDTVVTERPLHATELACAAAAAGYDGAVAVGGDGTANEVLNGLVQAREDGVGEQCALGLLPIGRGNDFAYGVGVPSDLAVACRALAEDHRHTIDVGRVSGGLVSHGRYFGNGVGIGFDAAVGFEAVKLTWLSGFPSYIVATLRTALLYYTAPTVTVECDDETFTLSALMVSVMNGRRMGGGFMMAPDARPDDGLFDLCIARQVSRLDVFRLVPYFMRGTQATQEAITTARARRVVVTAHEGTLPAHGDGETICLDGTQLEIELLPGKLEVIRLPSEDPV